MPTYEYQCTKCNVVFEEFQLISAEALSFCKKCKTNNLKRLISGGAGLLFKGSGFYTTDYRSDTYKKESKAETKSPAKTSETKKTPSSEKKTSNAKTDKKK